MNSTTAVCQGKFDQNKVPLDINLVKSNFTVFCMPETFGQWLTRTRRAAGYNRAELATLSRVTRATISLYELDKVEQPRRSQVDKIARALNVPVDEARQAAGYASKDIGTQIQIADDVRVAMLGADKFTEEDKKRFEIAFRAAYATALKMIEEDKQQ